MATVATDIMIELENKPGALAEVAKAISDAGVNVAAATCVGPRLEGGAPHPGAARRTSAGARWPSPAPQ